MEHKHRIKLKRFKSKKIQLGRSKQVHRQHLTTWQVFRRREHRVQSVTPSQQYQAVAKKPYPWVTVLAGI